MKDKRAQRFKICGSFVHFTIIFVLDKKYLKLLTTRIKKFLIITALVIDSARRRHEKTSIVSPSDAHSNTRIAMVSSMYDNPIPNASLSVHGHFSTTLRHPSPSQAHSNIRIAQSSPAQSNTECKSQYMGILPWQKRRRSVACAKVQVLAIESHHPSEPEDSRTTCYSLLKAIENKGNLNTVFLIFLNFETTNQWPRTCTKKLKQKAVEDAPHDLSVPQPYILSLFFRSRSWQLQALSAWLSVQSIQI